LHECSRLSPAKGGYSLLATPSPTLMGTHVKKFETFLVAPTSFMNKNLSIFKNTFVNVTGMVFFRFNRSWFERMLS